MHLFAILPGTGADFREHGVHDGHRRLVVRLRFAELLLGAPLFRDFGVDQLVEIIKVLGTPSRDDIREMNASYTEFKFLKSRARAGEVFRSRTRPKRQTASRPWPTLLSNA